MLDNLGSPLGLAGLAAHLYWAEPANLLLTSLIQRSVFHTISCQDHSLSLGQKQKTLLIVLSNMFNPLKLHRSVTRTAPKTPRQMAHSSLPQTLHSCYRTTQQSGSNYVLSILQVSTSGQTRRSVARASPISGTWFFD